MRKNKYGKPIRKSLFEKMLEDDDSKVTKYIFVVCAILINTILTVAILENGISWYLIINLIVYIKILFVALKK